MPTQQAIPRLRLSSPSAGQGRGVFLLEPKAASLQLQVLPAGDGGAADPAPAGAHRPAEQGQGGSAVPKALETPAVPQTAAHRRQGRSSRLNAAW